MTPLVPIMMFGWLFLSIYLFKTREPRDAIIIIAVGGVLFLPVHTYPLPGLPEYSKFNAIAYSLLVGALVSGKGKGFPFGKDKLDLPMVVFCTLSPIATSISNGLGLYNGISNAMGNYLSFGIFFWIGRQYFRDAESMRKLTYSLVVGGLIYFPLIVFEVRMSPQLSNIVYGFFPHSFVQHIRYGGFRPIVFMTHGLNVALWSAFSTIAIYWLWRSRQIPKFMNVSMGLLTLVQIVGTVLCKSMGPLIFMAIGMLLYSVVTRTKSSLVFKIMLLLPIAYIAFRISGVLPISLLEKELVKYFDAERVQSALMRMTQEDLFGARTSLRPIFGWGGYGRGWPRDERTGQTLIAMIDSLWIIEYNTYGFVGLASMFLALGIGPWRVIGEFSKRRALDLRGDNASLVDGLLLSLLCCLLILDSLMNASLHPVYMLFFGALASYSVELRAEREVRVALPVLGEGARGWMFQS